MNELESGISIVSKSAGLIPASTVLIPTEIIPTLLKVVESVEVLSCTVNLEVDARQLTCPLPLLKAKQGLRALIAGDLMRVLTTDVGTLKDFVSFAQLTGQLIEGFWSDKGSYCFLIRKQ